MTTETGPQDPHHSLDDCWVPVFVAWADGEVDTLDFGGREVPQRIQDILVAPTPAQPFADLLASLDRERAVARGYASEIAQIRAALGEVAVYEGVAAPVPMMVSELARDHEELERRLDAIAMECQATAFSSNPMAHVESGRRIAEIVKGGGKTPDTLEGLDG